MAIAESPREPITRPAAPPWSDVLHDWATTVDHKKIGISYVIMAVVFLVVGGVEALLLRWQLMWPRYDFLGPDTSTAIAGAGPRHRRPPGTARP